MSSTVPQLSSVRRDFRAIRGGLTRQDMLPPGHTDQTKSTSAPEYERNDDLADILFSCMSRSLL